MIFTPEEIQDLEDAIYFAIETMAVRAGHSSEPKDRENKLRFIKRLMRLKTKLSEPVEWAGNN